MGTFWPRNAPTNTCALPSARSTGEGGKVTYWNPSVNSRLSVLLTDRRSTARLDLYAPFESKKSSDRRHLGQLQTFLQKTNHPPVRTTSP